MVYSNRFVLCVLVGGKPQNELANGIVPINFGEEYSLRFRNKNDRRAVVKFTIDGENVSGDGYIIPANSAIDIHRHWDKDAKFRFVELDSPEAVDHGKNGPNLDGSKGVVEAKFYLEKPRPVVSWPVHHHHYHHYHYDHNIGDIWPGANPPATFCNLNEAMPQNSCEIPKSGVMSDDVATFKRISLPRKRKLLEGCTVEGGRSYQTFGTENIDLETDYVMVRCILKGIKKDKSVNAIAEGVLPVYCTSCGAKKVRQKDNFCGVCGNRF